MDSERRPLILLLGTDRYILEACLRRGIDAVVVIGAGGWDDGLVEIDDTFTVLRVDDQSSAEAVLMALHRAGLADRAFDGIQTTDEWSLVTAALLARHLGCEAIAPDTAVHFRDKFLQKRRVAAAGVNAARVTVIDDIHDVSAFDELPYERAVLKPVAGAATARTTVVASLADLRERSAEYARAHTSQRTFALEEYVQGDEWVADGVLHDGELLFCALGRYGAPCLTTVEQDLPLYIRRFDTAADSWAYDKALPVVRQALSALRLEDGVFHMELFHDPATGELTFSECAARRGGALVHEELQAKFNVNLCDAALQCALGRRPELDVKERPETIGGTYLMAQPGTLIHSPAPADILALPGVEFVRVDRPYGTRFASSLASTNQRIGQFLVAADSEEQLLERFADVRAWFDERVIVVPDTTRARDLRAWQRHTWPETDFRDTLWH
ncbi:hypothetical protein ACIHCV_29060 [Streptomyces sp. NPDC051956]|uniref:hypothetical protein n=1 Tax=Streptomyces sp. NPDC051956 TaxID=3365677 RepID=UPI0037CD0FAC